MVEGQEIDFGKITADLHLENETLTGAVSNLTGYTIQDATLIWAKSFQRLGDIEPGASVDISLDLAELIKPNFGAPLSYQIFEETFNQSGPNGPAREAEVRRSIVEGLLERTPPFKSSVIPGAGQYTLLTQTPLFLGWVDQAPPETTVAGEVPAQQTTAAVLASLSYSTTGNQISLPGGLIPGRIVTYPVDGGTCGDPNSTAIYLNRGETVFEFSLPNQFQNITIQNLKLSIWSDSNWIGAPAVAFFNWQTGAWVELNGVNQGVNLVPDAASMVNSSGSIQVRLWGKENAVACYFLGLGLEGQLK